MLDSNWSYFSAASYMKWFIAHGIIRCLLYDLSLWPNMRMFVCNAAYTYMWARAVRVYMRVYLKAYVCLERSHEKKMVTYLGKKLACFRHSDSGERCKVERELGRAVRDLSPSLVFIFSRSFLIRTAPHYLNAWNRLEKKTHTQSRKYC